MLNIRQQDVCSRDHAQCCGVDKLGGRGVRVRFPQLKACQTILRIPTPLHEQSKQHREGGLTRGTQLDFWAANAHDGTDDLKQTQPH